MKELRIKSIVGSPVCIMPLESGGIRIVHQHGSMGWDLEQITPDAESVAKLRDWLADDCCDVRRADSGKA